MPFKSLTTVLRSLFGLTLIVLMGLPSVASAQTPSLASRTHALPQATDFNLITAVDVSDSITQEDEWLQYTGLARGVLNAEFLARIAQGTQQRIGFAAFTWSSGGKVDVIVPWTVIGTRADAERVAAQFEGAPRIDRSTFGRYRPLSTGAGASQIGLTDIAEAIRAAVEMALTAPYSADRSVINVLSNGVDNNGEDPSGVRDQAVAMGMTINGVVFGNHADLPRYFRERVIGGPGAFLMTVAQPDDLAPALERKFWQDMIAALAAPQAG